MAGARFVRADLHVHLIPDGLEEPTQAAAAYIQEAVNRDIEVLGITDHNSARHVREAMRAAQGKPMLVLPGVEVSGRDGHLLAYFPPDRLDELEAFATAENLDLGARLKDGSRRSSRTMLHLLNEVEQRQGIALIAHCDANDGVQAGIDRGELAEVLCHPALAGLEFYNLANLQTWFREDDEDDARREAWQRRQRIDELRDRGLALVMSSDAHDSSLVGKDGTNRPLTRLRVGDTTYTAVKNALLNNPKARCKIEATLPTSYPHVVSASFEGGFLDGVTIDFAQNLNCLIGGRGSGKSTALLAIRAALGAVVPDGDDPDDPVRMPARTVVHFVDAAGTAREAIRQRKDIPRDADDVPVELPLADLGQDESGQVASTYRDQPLQMLSFLDSFCELDKEVDAERDVLDRLTDNAAEVIRTAFRREDYKLAEADRQRLEANIKAAEKGQLESIAVRAVRLATQAALISQVRSHLGRVTTARPTAKLPSLKALAAETNTNLALKPISNIREPLDVALAELNIQLKGADTAHAGSIRAATTKLTEVLQEWEADYARWEAQRQQKQADLEQQGLSVQVGALNQMSQRLGILTKRLAEMEEKRKQHTAALAERESLLSELRERRRLIFVRRRATIRLVTKRANESSLDLTVNVSFRHEGVRKPWRDWLGPRFGFKADRLRRLGVAIRPWEFAASITRGDLTQIGGLLDSDGDGQPFFNADDLVAIAGLSWSDRFELETMRLEDLPRIDITDPQHGEPREFDRLSAGQQRSVLLSLLLCADRSDPLIIDQPEDHLDAPYIASGVVRHLEQAKERRQVIIATHNANLTVLGDAELVIPLYAEEGKGTPHDAGAVDHPDTLRHVCRLLEGGATAYVRRGHRYGFDIGSIPAGLTAD